MLSAASRHAATKRAADPIAIGKPLATAPREIRTIGGLRLRGRDAGVVLPSVRFRRQRAPGIVRELDQAGHPQPAQRPRQARPGHRRGRARPPPRRRTSAVGRRPSTAVASACSTAGSPSRTAPAFSCGVSSKRGHIRRTARHSPARLCRSGERCTVRVHAFLRLPPPRWAFSSPGPCPHQGSFPQEIRPP